MKAMSSRPNTPRLDRFELIERLRARIGHDLRTPLTVIIGYASLVAGDDLESQAASDAIVAAAEHVSAALDDLELVLGLSSGAIEARPAPVDLRRIVEEAAHQVHRRRRQPLDEPAGSGRPTVHADSEHLTRALRRVIASACEHAPVGVRIEVEADVENDHAAVRVTGANLTDAADSDLRLALAAALLELGGGSLEFHGDVATILVPRAARQATAA